MLLARSVRVFLDLCDANTKFPTHAHTHYPLPSQQLQISALLADLDHVDMLVFAAQEAVWSGNGNKSKKKKKDKRRVADRAGGGGGGGSGHHSSGSESSSHAGGSSQSDVDELALDEGLVDVSHNKQDDALDPFTEMVHRRAALVGFHAVRALAMGEIRLLVYGRKNLVDSGRISELETSCVPTGFNGVGTNKGGVILKLYVFATYNDTLLGCCVVTWWCWPLVTVVLVLGVCHCVIVVVVGIDCAWQPHVQTISNT